MNVWLLQRAEPTPHDNNGKQRAMRMGIIAQMLARYGHETLWWTSTFDHYNRRHRYKKDIKVSVESKYNIQYLYGCGYNRNISFSRIKEDRMIAQRFSYLASRETEKPDIIIASIPTSSLALAAVKYGQKHNIPVFLDIRDMWPDVFFDLVPIIFHPFVQLISIPYRRRLKKACRGATGILGLTNSFVNWGVDHAGREPKENDRVFPMGYLTKSFTEEQINVEREYWNKLDIHSNGQDLIVTFFGTLGKCFNISPVVDAAQILLERHSSVKFVICGDGENLRELKEKAQGVANIIFPGWVNEMQIRALLEISDVGLAPYIESMNFINNIPNKPAEYLSGGAVIALSLERGELYNLLGDYDCGFCYQNKPEILASELDFLSKNSDRLKIMQQNALQVFEKNFIGELIYAQLIAFLEEIVKSNKDGVN